MKKFNYFVQIIRVFLKRDAKKPRIKREKVVGIIKMGNVEREIVLNNYQAIQLRFVISIILVVFSLD